MLSPEDCKFSKCHSYQCLRAKKEHNCSCSLGGRYGITPLSIKPTLTNGGHLWAHACRRGLKTFTTVCYIALSSVQKYTEALFTCLQVLWSSLFLCGHLCLCSVFCPLSKYFHITSRFRLCCLPLSAGVLTPLPWCYNETTGWNTGRFACVIFLLWLSFVVWTFYFCVKFKIRPSPLFFMSVLYIIICVN